jgi:cytochrome c-type biogenesis protein CcmF
MAQIGSFALLLALCLSVYCFLAGFAALFRHDELGERIGESSRRAGIAVFFIVTVAALTLVMAAFTNNFGIEYIREHSNVALPLPYKFAVLWSGQEGSLLFWALLLSTYSLVLRLRHRTDIRLFAHASVILAAVQTFFLLLVVFAAPPFAVAEGPMVADGNGLNPLLQYPEMVAHPPMLYLGYVGFTVPFAFALGALIMRYPGEKWIHITRRWTMVTWGFLSIGVSLGAHWAYNVLGWGGYWGWDPVENASILPWFTGTAFLHSVMMQEKRGMLKIWNVWLIFITFLLSILGTFLTRSGVVSSVHAFAQSSIGTWFLIFMGLILAVCLFFFFKNRSHLQSEHKLESLVSRESSFLFNNLLFVALCFTVLWGTLFPVLSDWIQGHKVTVGPPFFNKVAVPSTMLLLMLTALGPLLPWRSASLDAVKRNFLWPTVGALLVAVALVVGGVRPWQDQSYFYALMTWALATLVTLTVAFEFGRGGRVIASKTGQGLAAAMVQLTRRNTRRYGGYIVHFGIALLLIGVAGAAFNQEKEQEMGNGDHMQIGTYDIVCRSYTEDDNPNFASESAILDVFQNGRQIDTLYPARLVFKASNQPNTRPYLHSTLKEDLYAVFEGRNEQTGRPILKIHVNPLVNWIWIGVIIVILGTALAMIPNAAPVRVAVTAAVEAVPVGAGD